MKGYIVIPLRNRQHFFNRDCLYFISVCVYVCVCSEREGGGERESIIKEKKVRREENVGAVSVSPILYHPH